MKNFMHIFSWEEWQDFGDAFEMYFDCELLIDLGEFEDGQEFPMVVFDKKRMMLSFYNDEDGTELAMEKRFVLED